MRPNRLTLNDALFPVQAFFNAIPDAEFPRVIALLVSGVGYVFNEVACTFPDDLDPGDEQFEGVQFAVGNEEITLPRAECAKYIELAIEQHLKSRPADAPALNRSVQELKTLPEWQGVV
jgi:hypothetical protein